ncbi:MAG: hypothetical protein M0T84_02435 [Betaproteobacteria bacterium]|nr:hypothetical protein [Betaproteobacteria bacterium]
MPTPFIPPHRRRKPSLALLLAGLSLVGCSRTQADWNLARLSSLSNYSWSHSIDNGVSPITLTGVFVNSSNYEFRMNAGAQTRVIGSQVFEHLGVAPLGNFGWMLLRGQRLPSEGEVPVARHFFDIVTNTAAYRTKASGPCRVAGEVGTQYLIQSRNGGPYAQRGQACVASRGGALLSFSFFASGSGPARMGERFVVTRIGGFRSFPVPSTASPFAGMGCRFAVTHAANMAQALKACAKNTP